MADPRSDAFARAARPIAGFCAATVLFLVWRDLFLPEVRDVEVWFGVELRGVAAWATAPLHWAIFALGALGYGRRRPWVWPWAPLYAAQIAVGHLVWNLTSPHGEGLFAGSWQCALFALPAVGLWWLRPTQGTP